MFEDPKKIQKSKSLKTLRSPCPKPMSKFDFCTCPSQNVVKRNSSGIIRAVMLQMHFAPD